MLSSSCQNNGTAGSDCLETSHFTGPHSILCHTLFLNKLPQAEPDYHGQSSQLTLLAFCQQGIGAEVLTLPASDTALRYDLEKLNQRALVLSEVETGKYLRLDV